MREFDNFKLDNDTNSSANSNFRAAVDAEIFNRHESTQFQLAINRTWNFPKYTLEKQVNQQSIVDEVRKQIGDVDRIHTFNPTERVAPSLCKFDPEKKNYWTAISNKVEQDWKNPTIWSDLFWNAHQKALKKAIRDLEDFENEPRIILYEKRQEHYYGVNPDSGRVELKPNVKTMDFRLT